MAIRTDINSILILGSGPIMVGQACEFDYSGCQAIQVLRSEGYRTILVNPNPATVMTTPELSDALYMDPLEPAYIEKIIMAEKPDAILPTMGGQTALNCTVALHKEGILERHGVELLGVSVHSIELAEDRKQFRELMTSIGLQSPKSFYITSIEEGMQYAEQLGTPLIVRPSFTLGGSGGGIVQSTQELSASLHRALTESPEHSALIEESLIGWGEFEFEVMRDNYDNAVIVCAIENVDAMGIHTGDSITVAPTQTLNDQEYQRMRDAAIAILRAVGVTCGGSNVQFAYNHATGALRVIEMNPRVSRSSALASKATGYPIARVATKLAIGYGLHEVVNEITEQGSACFEPTLDYLAVKVPRFEIGKFAAHTTTLDTAMKSIGESLAMGRNFIAALNKALRATENGFDGLAVLHLPYQTLVDMLWQFHPNRLCALFTLLFWYRCGEAHSTSVSNQLSETDAATLHTVVSTFATTDELTVFLQQQSKYHSWFMHQVVQFIDWLVPICHMQSLTQTDCMHAQRLGVSYRQLTTLRQLCGAATPSTLQQQFLTTAYHMVDTCAGEFAAVSPYFYSAPGEINEIKPLDGQSVLIIGSGPNRIGQGLEFDNCCAMASMTFRTNGIKTIIVNSNPETVSTDHNYSDRLYIEPLSFEHIMQVLNSEGRPKVVVQLGGQTAINMVARLQAEGIEIIGTAQHYIDMAEDREQFAQMIKQIGLTIPQTESARSKQQAVAIAEQIGFPVLVRPSFVLGGARMAIASNLADIHGYLEDKVVSDDALLQIDQFLEDSFEYDIDVIADGESVFVAGVMEHIESAGIHSGDSACVFPPYKFSPPALQQMKQMAVQLARHLHIVGFMNIQCAVKDDTVYVIEVNPRVSRTIPFISKAIGINLVQIAVNIWCGRSLKAQQLVDDSGYGEGHPIHPWAIKEAKFSFNKFKNFDPKLGPEMRSTGESIGVGTTFGAAYTKAISAVGVKLPTEGAVAISVHDKDKPNIVNSARALQKLGFMIYATAGTALFLAHHNITSITLLKAHQKTPYNTTIIDYIESDRIQFIINTPLGSQTHRDDSALRLAAIRHHVPYTTTTSAADAAIEGIHYLRQHNPEVMKIGTTPIAEQHPSTD